jgi:AhpD family alkylhydroperoxidase
MSDPRDSAGIVVEEMTMTISKLTITATLLAIVPAASANPDTKPDRDAKATYQDIQKTLGFVPGFFKAFPETGIAAAWDEVKSVHLSPTTALSGKTKELIGLAVSAQIPCRPCVYFHTQLAKLNGASNAELADALGMSAHTRHWSTFLNGTQIDLPEFKQDMARVFAYLKHPMASGDVGPVTDAASAYKDIERTVGSVPAFLRRFPEDAIAPAWRMMKSIELGTTALPGKTKELIGLAVAAQIPCQYCIYFHTEAAKLNGASEREIREAVTMAALVRTWSTVIDASVTDEVEFRRQVDQIVSGAKKSAKH